MNEVLQQIDRLFADNTVPPDRRGSLQRVARLLSAFNPRILFLARADGQLLAVRETEPDQCADDVSALARELARLVSRKPLHTCLRTVGPDELLAFAVSLADADGTILGGLLGAPTAPDRAFEELQPAIDTCGSLVFDVLLADEEARHLAARIRHLTAEHDTLKTAHRACVATVIDEREARIREQRDYVVHLEQEVEKRSSALHEAMKRAEDANRSKSEFLANVSHEIRTPMTAILGFADLLLDPDLSRDQEVKAVQTIQRNGRHLLEIINDILDLSKVEAGKMVVEQIPCSPVQIINDVMTSLATRAQAKDLALDVEYVAPIPETIHSDPTRLRQILINIVGNAVKFTAAGSVRLTVRLLASEGHDPMMQFDVTDTGIGMTRTEIGGIFEPFSQGDASTTRKFGGTGLGLALARRLANVLGGDVAVVETSPGKGTRVRATVSTGPLNGVRMVADAAQLPRTPLEIGSVPTASEATILGSRILLAEDSPDSQRLIVHLLQKAGAGVTAVDNGQRAVEEALAASNHGTPFDVILMDMQMPVMDGYEAARLLRSEGYTGRIVALTAHAMTDDRRKCLDAGCDTYAVKPITRQHLFAVIQEMLSAAETSPAAAASVS